MNVRQFFKLVSILSVAYGICYIVIYFSTGPITTIIDGMLAASLFIIPVGGAMSFGMFTYVDNMAKDLTDLRNEVNREKYLAAQEDIGALKKEVLLNAGLIIGLCLLEQFSKAAAIYFISSLSASHVWLVTTIFTSLRFAFFTAAMWSAISQLSGFVIAVEFRTLIASNRK